MQRRDLRNCSRLSDSNTCSQTGTTDLDLYSPPSTQPPLSCDQPGSERRQRRQIFLGANTWKTTLKRRQSSRPGLRIDVTHFKSVTQSGYGYRYLNIVIIKIRNSCLLLQYRKFQAAKSEAVNSFPIWQHCTILEATEFKNPSLRM